MSDIETVRNLLNATIPPESSFCPLLEPDEADALKRVLIVAEAAKEFAPHAKDRYIERGVLGAIKHHAAGERLLAAVNALK